MVLCSSSYGQILWSIPDTNHWDIQDIAISSDGGMSIVNTGVDCRSYRIDDGKLIGVYGPPKGRGVAIATGGGLVALASDSGRIKLVNTYDSDAYHYIPSPDPLKDYTVVSMDWTKDGSYLVAAYFTPHNQLIVLWDMSNDSIVWGTNFDSLPGDLGRSRLIVKFSPTDEYVGVKPWGGGYSYMFDMKGNDLQLYYPSGEQGALAFAPDGHRYMANRVEYDITDSLYHRPVAINTGIAPYAYIAPDRVFIIITPDAGWFELDDFNKGRIRQFMPVDTPMNLLDVSLNGSTAVTAGRSIYFWDLSRYTSDVSSTTEEIDQLEAVTDNARIIITPPNGQGEIFIYGFDGRCYFRKGQQNRSEEIVSDKLSPGLYFVSFQTKLGKIAVKKVLIY